MLKQHSLETTLVGELTNGDGAFHADEDARAYHSDDDLSELALLKHEVGEMRRELRDAREKIDASLHLAERQDHLRASAQARRKRLTKGAVVARAILSVMVGVFTLAGALAGVSVGLTVVHVGGDGFVWTVAAVVSGIAVALAGWLLAALAAIVVETADAVRDLPG